MGEYKDIFYWHLHTVDTIFAKAPYSEYAMRCVRKNKGLEEEDTCLDTVIRKMPRKEVLDRVLEWNNLSGGWSDQILECVDSVLGTELREYFDEEWEDN